MRTCPSLCSWCFLALVCLFSITGCDFFGRDKPSEALLRVEGEVGGEGLLIVSSNFLSQTQTKFDDNGLPVGDTLLVRLLSADTLTVSLPFERRYDIRENRQFFVRIRPLNPLAETLTVRLWIDGRLRGEKRYLPGLEAVTIVYNFDLRPYVPIDDDKT